MGRSGGGCFFGGVSVGVSESGTTLDLWPAAGVRMSWKRMVCLRGRGMRGRSRSMSSNGVKTTASVPVGEPALEPQGDAPVGQQGQPVGRDRRPGEVAGKVLEAVAVVGGEAYVGVEAEPSTVAQRRPRLNRSVPPF